MKQKKNSRAKKILLMGISCVLVAALSVSFTLAYLTAKTGSKDNKFKASQPITGEVIEPDYDITMAQNWKPGDTIPKNPMVDNDTANYDVWVGASIEYQLSADDGSTYKTVDYDTFSHYVTVTGKTQSNWVSMSPVSTGTGAVDGAALKKDYYFYNTKLLKQTTEETAETSYNGTTAFGTTGSVTSDNTTELFKTVRPEANLDISPDYTATNAPFIGDTTTRKTLITETDDIPVCTTENGTTTHVDITHYCFNSFKFKIKITGYGIKDDVTIAGGTATTLNGTDLTSVEDAILIGLGGKVKPQS